MNTSVQIDKYQDIIDSRDVIARIEELREELSDLQSDRDEERDPDDTDEYQAAVYALKEWHDDNDAELTALESLASEASDYAADWIYGEALIRDSYFETYAQDMAEDIGAIDSNAQWPNTCIDWEQAASELQMDYTSVDFDGVTYWIR